MNQSHSMTGIIECEEDGYVALCPELDIASQGVRSRRRGTTSSKRWTCSSSVLTPQRSRIV